MRRIKRAVATVTAAGALTSCATGERPFLVEEMPPVTAVSSASSADTSVSCVGSILSFTEFASNPLPEDTTDEDGVQNAIEQMAARVCAEVIEEPNDLFIDLAPVGCVTGKETKSVVKISLMQDGIGPLKESEILDHVYFTPSAEFTLSDVCAAALAGLATTTTVGQ